MDQRVAVLVGVAGIVWALASTEEGGQVVADTVDAGKQLLGLWRPPEQYANAIASAEARHGLPTDMLARMLWQESRYRPDIISGAKRSTAGAIGIAQFMPSTARDMGIDPTDPWASIEAAARYLAQQYRSFGDWSAALAAYNWGPGNVRRYGVARAPAETQRYVADIMGDLGVA